MYIIEPCVERPQKILFPLTLFGKATSYKLHELATQHISLIYIINSESETEKSVLSFSVLEKREDLPVTSKLNS